MEERIRKAIDSVLGELGLEGEFVVEYPMDESHGDYASNVAMVVGGNPREMAERIVNELEKNESLMDDVEVSVAGPGFINFKLKDRWLVAEMKRVDADYGRGSDGRKMLVEYSSPNIAKDFSVGHLRSTIIGQAIRNLYEFLGWETIGDNHVGDWGTQFGVMIAAVEESGKDISEMEVSEMEELYVEYNRRIGEDVSLLDKAREAFVRLEKGDEGAVEIWKKAREVSLDEFKKVYDLLGVEIENMRGESEYEGETKAVIEEAKSKGLTVESEGALIMEFDDMPPAMLVKSDGGSTYFARDLATIKFRRKEFDVDRYVYEVGAEQTLHFRQVFAAAEMLGYGKESEYVHVAHGLILGEDGKKMSTRKGTGVKMEEWLSSAKRKALTIYESHVPRGVGNLGIDHKDLSRVGIGSVKFFDLKHSPGTSYKFDWDEALRLDGDSGPYVQYAVVRGKSVLDKGEKSYEEMEKLNEEEMAVLRWLHRFPRMVVVAAEGYAPNLMAEYLLELSKRFNGFYNKQRIVGSEEEGFRLGLTRAVVQVLESGLGLLGVEVPRKM